MESYVIPRAIEYFYPFVMTKRATSPAPKSRNGGGVPDIVNFPPFMQLYYEITERKVHLLQGDVSFSLHTQQGNEFSLV